MPDLESDIRESIARLACVDARSFAMDASLDDTPGLTSMKMVLLSIALCKATGISLTEFTEQDLAAMTTPEAIRNHLSRKLSLQEA